MKVSFNQVKNNYTFKGGNNRTNIASYVNTERMVDSFVSLAKMDSGSLEKMAEKSIPSTVQQFEIAKVLKAELEKLGLSDVHLDEHCILIATLDTNLKGDVPVVGFLAHMDTSQDAPNKNVKPQIHDYKGGPIKLAGGSVIEEDILKAHIGDRIITSNGRTLLGADDKAGIAEILEALKVFIEHPEIKRPKIRIAFTPDEETGLGVSKFDIKKFGADLAYTVDGDHPNVIECESFNAFNPKIVIKGLAAHCGYAKGKMINSIGVANWIMSKLPQNQRPETTEGRQGYYHVDEIKGKIDKTELNLLVRDHDMVKAQKRLEFLQQLVKKAEIKFNCKIEFDPKPRYQNMKSEIDKLPGVMAFAKQGVRRTGLQPKTVAIRGGTDGSQLSLRGLIAPNLGTGGQNFHSKTEFVPVGDMVKSVQNIVNIAMVWAEKSEQIMPKILARRV